MDKEGVLRCVSVLERSTQLIAVVFLVVCAVSLEAPAGRHTQLDYFAHNIDLYGIIILCFALIFIAPMIANVLRANVD